jgi:hypothetical protein
VGEYAEISSIIQGGPAMNVNGLSSHFEKDLLNLRNEYGDDDTELLKELRKEQSETLKISHEWDILLGDQDKKL